MSVKILEIKGIALENYSNNNDNEVDKASDNNSRD